MKYCPRCKKTWPHTLKICPKDKTPLEQMMPDDKHIGQTIDGRYKIIKRLGAGANGVIYQVEHITVKRRYAMKVLYAQLMGQPQIIERFEREARSGQIEGHRNVVEIVDFGHDPKIGYFLVMQYLEGEDLSERLHREKSSNLEETIDIIKQVAEGLKAAHSKRIIHRDLKPSNIFLTEEDGKVLVKILDFGLAKILHDPVERGVELSYAGQVLGTPAYLSPEQAKGQPIDGRSDIYALGLIFYEMLAGRKPFKAKTIHDIIRMHCEVPPPPFKQKVPHLNIPPHIEKIVMKMLAKNPNERYQGSMEIINDLNNAKAELSSPHVKHFLSMLASSKSDVGKVIHDSGRMVLTEDIKKDLQSRKPSPKPEKKSFKRKLLAGAGIFLVLIVVILIIWVMHLSSKPNTTNKNSNKKTVEKNHKQTPVNNGNQKITKDKDKEKSSLKDKEKSSLKDKEKSSLKDKEKSSLKDKEKSPLIDERRLIIIALFENKSQTKELDWLKLGLTDMAIAKLSQESELRVLSRQEIFRILKHHKGSPEEILSQVAKDRNATWILWGSYALFGNKIQLNLTLESVTDGKVIVSITENKPKDESLIQGMDVLLLKVRDKLLLAGSTQGLKSLAELRTSSPQAYYDYIQGLEYYEDEYIDKALDRLHHAVKLDPKFMIAHVLMAEIYDYIDDRQKAKFHIEKALEFAEEKTAEERLYAEAYKAYLGNNLNRALVLFRKIAEQAPRDVLVQSFYIEMLLYNDRLDEGLKLCQYVYKLDPTYSRSKLFETYIYSGLGRYDEAIATVKEYIKLLPNSPYPLEMAGDIHRRAGKWKVALEFFEKSKNLRKTRWINDQVFRVYRDMGQLKKAEKHIRDTDLKSSDPILKANAYHNLAIIAQIRGDFVEAMKYSENGAKHATHLIQPKTLMGIEHAREGNIQEARQILTQIEKMGGLTWERDSADELRAHLFLFQQNFKEARKYYRLAKQKRNFYDLEPVYYDRKIIETYLIEGDMNGALNLAEKLIKNRPYDVYLRLLYARALDGSGKSKEALANYQEILNIWKDADTDHPYIIFSTQRIKELQPEG